MKKKRKIFVIFNTETHTHTQTLKNIHFNTKLKVKFIQKYF